MVFEVGTRLKTEEHVTECRSEEECSGKTVELEMGRVYEFRARFEAAVPWAEPEGMDQLWEALKAVRREYPGVAVNYIYVSDDGKEVIIQVFDPKALIAPVIISIIKLLIIFVGLAVVTYLVYLVVTAIGKEVIQPVTEKIPKAPPWIWYAVGIGGTAVAVGFLIRSIRS